MVRVRTARSPKPCSGTLQRRGVEVRTALTLVQQDVYDRSRDKQLPYIESGLPRLFFAAEVAELGERDRLLVAMAGLSPALRAEVEALARDKDMPLAPLYGALISADLGGKDHGARAQDLVRQSYAIAQRLAAADPGNVENQMSLVASLVRVSIYDDDPKPRQREALAVLKALQAQGRLDPGRADWIGLIEAQLAAP